jgi:hypothetical protein
MLTSVEGVYRGGRVELIENPSDVPEGTWVIVTFVSLVVQKSLERLILRRVSHETGSTRKGRFMRR